MTDKHTLLVGITKVGNTPSLFDNNCRGRINSVSRDKIGLPDTEDLQTSVFCTVPNRHDQYWTFGMTVDELKQLHESGSLSTAGFTLILWPAYADINNAFFAELSNDTDQSQKGDQHDS